MIGRKQIEILAHHLMVEISLEARSDGPDEVNEFVTPRAMRTNYYYRKMAIAGIFLPQIDKINRHKLYDKAVEAERKEEGAGFFVLMEALGGKDDRDDR